MFIFNILDSESLGLLNILLILITLFVLATLLNQSFAQVSYNVNIKINHICNTSNILA